jgi:hypothetical protein
MNPSPSTSSRRLLLGAIVIVAAAAGGTLAWHSRRASPGKEQVAAFLDKAAGAGQLRFSAVTIEPLQKVEGDLQVTVTAQAWPLQPLYTRIDPADYLRRTFQLDPDAVAEARALLADRPAQAKPANAGAGPFPADPYEVPLLQLGSPPEVSFHYRCILDAHRDAGTWNLFLLSGAFEGASPQGEPRAGFGTLSFVPGEPADDARLRALAGDFQAFVERLANLRRNSELARTAAIAARRNAFLGLIAPGRVFRGQAQESGEQNATALYLEIVALSGDNEVTALLRNDGGWRSARAFQGTWSADDSFENPVLNLSSLANQAVRGSGPFLENTQTWVFALHGDSREGLSESNRFYQYRFQLLAPEQVSELKARLEAEFDRALAATEPGLLYQGAAVSRASGASEPILLRFVSRTDAGESLEARIESTTRSWKRPLHGALFGNARRSGAEPVRLRSGADEAVDDAPATSVLGDRDDMDIQLGFKGKSLVGGDGQFTYQFAAAGADDLRRLEADRAERARRFMLVLRDGIAYDGTLHEEQGFVTHGRLEITRFDRQTGAIAASIHSLARPSVYREFFGTCDPSGSSIELVATGRGNYGSDDNFDVPFLKGATAATLHLSLSGNSITARIEGDASWKMEFPAGAFLSAPTESPEPDSPAANGSVFPAFPKGGGAYLLTKDGWSPMPKNQSHVVIEMVRPKGDDLRLTTSLVGAVDEAISQLSNLKDKTKVTYLQFDGKDSRPQSSGQALVILFVGPDPSGRPPVELAPMDLTKDGQRRLVIKDGPTTDIRFGERRLAAYIRRVAPGYLLFTTTSAPAPGPYAFNANGGYELTQD